MPKKVSDAEIIQRSVADSQYFGELFDRHVEAIHKFFFHRVGKTESEDLLAETFRIAFEKRAMYDIEKENAKPWLYGIARNLLLHKYRKKDRKQKAYEKFRFLRVVTNDPIERVDEKETSRKQLAEIYSALEKLSDKERELVSLYAWDALSYKEISEILGIPVGTVRSRLNTTRKKIMNLTTQMDNNPLYAAHTGERK